MITHRVSRYVDDDWDYRYGIIQRILDLRRQTPCRLGVILVEGGHYFVCGCQYDPLGEMNPHGQKNHYTLAQLDQLCRELERDLNLVWIYAPSGICAPTEAVRKTSASEINYNKITKIA